MLIAGMPLLRVCFDRTHKRFLNLSTLERKREDIATHEDSTARLDEQFESLTIENERLLKNFESLEKDARDTRALVKVNADLYEVKFHRMQNAKEAAEWENIRLEKKLKEYQSLIAVMKSNSLYNMDTGTISM